VINLLHYSIVSLRRKPPNKMSLAVRNTLLLSRKLAANPNTKSAYRKLSSTEAIPAFPVRNTLGLTKLVAVVSPFIYFGGMVSMHGAAFLEDYDIFVPEDDDDD